MTPVPDQPTSARHISDHRDAVHPASHFTMNAIVSLAGSVLDKLGIHRFSHVRYRKMTASLMLDSDPKKSVMNILRAGASKFGLWRLSDKVLEPLVSVVLSSKSSPFSKFKRVGSAASLASLATEGIAEEFNGAEKFPGSFKKLAVMSKKIDWFGVILTILMTGICCWYGFYAALKSGAVKLLGWPIIIARATGLGTVLWTSVMLFSMTRSLTTFLYRWMKFPALLQSISLHLLSATNLSIHAILHTIAHMENTYPKLIHANYKDWNAKFRCAKSFFHRVTFLEYPPCPLTEDLTVAKVLTSTVVVSGIVLFVFLMLFPILSMRRFRDKNHRAFRILHNILLAFWIVALYFHGGSQFFGIGIPLVVPVCGLFILAYIGHKIKQHFLPLSAVINSAEFITERVLSVSIAVDGAAKMAEGMFVLLKVPEISRFDFHPFSVCPHSESELRLAIGIRGSWTKKLSERCKRGVPVEVKLAGPFGSPALALDKRNSGDVLIIVASGVGITPFLGSIASLAEKSCELYLYWIVRYPQEILHAREIFGSVINDPKIRMFVHVTNNPETTDSSAFYFSETLRTARAVLKSKDTQKYLGDSEACFTVRQGLFHNLVFKDNLIEDSAAVECRNLSLRVNLPDELEASFTLRFGRPHWLEELSRIEASGTRWVFVCGRQELSKQLTQATDACAEASGHPFVVTTEEF